MLHYLFFTLQAHSYQNVWDASTRVQMVLALHNFQWGLQNFLKCTRFSQKYQHNEMFKNLFNIYTHFFFFAIVIWTLAPSVESNRLKETQISRKKGWWKKRKKKLYVSVHNLVFIGQLCGQELFAFLRFNNR